MIEHTPSWLDCLEASAIFELHQTLPLIARPLVVFDKTFIMPRKTCFFSTSGRGYTYSNQTTEGMAFPEDILPLKERLETQFKCRFDHCLVNFYENNTNSVGWHKDNDHLFPPNRQIIASVSAGAPRRFVLRETANRKNKKEYLLGDGDLFVMEGEHVMLWEHSIPKSTKPIGPRINYTFRSSN